MGFPTLDEIPVDTLEFLLNTNVNPQGSSKKPPDTSQKVSAVKYANLAQLSQQVNPVLPVIPAELNPLAQLSQQVNPVLSALPVQVNSVSPSPKEAYSFSQLLTPSNPPIQLSPLVNPASEPPKPMDLLSQLKQMQPALSQQGANLTTTEVGPSSPVDNKSVKTYQFNNFSLFPELDLMQELSVFDDVDMKDSSIEQDLKTIDPSLIMPASNLSSLTDESDSDMFHSFRQPSPSNSSFDEVEGTVLGMSRKSLNSFLDDDMMPSPTGSISCYFSDDKLRDMSIPDLNRVKGLSKEELKELKRKRRVLKNRIYAQHCRDKRELTAQSSRQIIESLEKDLKRTSAERDSYKKKFHQLLVYFHKAFLPQKPKIDFN